MSGQWWLGYIGIDIEMEAIRKLDTIKSVKLAIAFVVLNIVDAALTVAAADKGGYELLPIARQLLGQSPWVFWVFKIGMTSLFAFALLILSDKYPQQIRRILFILVVAMVGICLVNGVGLWL